MLFFLSSMPPVGFSQEIGWGCTARFPIYLFIYIYLRPDSAILPYNLWPDFFRHVLHLVPWIRPMRHCERPVSVASSKKHIKTREDWSAETIPYLRAKWPKSVLHFRPKQLKKPWTINIIWCKEPLTKMLPVYVGSYVNRQHFHLRSFVPVLFWGHRSYQIRYAARF